MSSLICGNVEQLPTWNRHKISPTYISTNLITPLQLPFRDTVARSRIIAEGTSRRFPRFEWGSFQTDYGGIGKLPMLGKIRQQNHRELPLPRSHRHYLSSCGKMIHGVVQPSKITSLLRSKLRQNDEFILSPNLCINIALMKEDNHFYQEPCYSSHSSKNDMFPRSRAEHAIPPLPNELRQSTPLCDTTRQGLAGVVHRRYKVSSYANDFRTPSPSSKNEKTQKQTPETKMTCPLNQPKGHDHKVTGLWPCWPAGNNYIICDVTGQIVEKRDVVSLDDKRDYTKYKMSQQYPPHEKPAAEPYKPVSDYRSFASSDYVPVAVDIYGCGPGCVGTGNPDREIPAGVHLHRKRYSKINNPGRKSAWDHLPVNPITPPWAYHPTNAARETVSNSEVSQPGNDVTSYPHQRHQCRINKYRGNEGEIDVSMRNRWVENKKMVRLAERTTPHLASCKEQSGLPALQESKSNTSALDDIEIEDIEEDDTENDVSQVDINDKRSDISPKSSYSHRPPFATTAHHRSIAENTQQKLPQKPPSPPLLCSREMGTLSCLLQSISAAEKDQKRIEERKTISNITPMPANTTMPCPTTDPTSSFYQPAIKPPPSPLWNNLQYTGDRVPHRLGVRFKTVASKRYHMVHPETIPDLRDFRSPQRRSKFLGYHTSVFR
uniref:uncharacterized protein LOC100179794 isoform X2 n=1 Tax=Ciona intestinalis TaxID=7719 RepID=UPI000EF493A1|nr:uncharacterized protein LOC100179794 isoform X2 [Ciona intestinalis]|eukprot:XP_026693285.1 uncharacterized protein LOC100179794 isoform X2 [Ciona intestinalis]